MKTTKKKQHEYGKTKWDLKLLYKSENDPKIEEDIGTFEKSVIVFEKKYRNDNTYLTRDSALARALKEYEALSAMPESWRSIRYFHLLTDLDSSNNKAQAAMSKFSERLTKISNRLIFFDLTIGKISKNKQREFLKSPKLSRYRYYLKYIFETAEHNLSEPEERIMNLKSLPSHTLWVQGQEKLLNSQTVKHNGKDLPLPQALNELPLLSTPQRRKLHGKIMRILRNISSFAESEINAVYLNKKINDELKKFKEPYSATLLGNQNDEKTILALVEAVTRNFTISHDFYAIKAKLLKEKYLEYADRAANIGVLSKRISYEEGYNIVLNSLRSTDSVCADIFEDYAFNGQIDVFSKKGKTGGAYCSGAVNMPTYVLLNYTDSMDSVTTLAHEMGHAIHTELSKVQSPVYQGYSTSVAEVASTFFEKIVSDELLATLSEKERIIALHNHIQDDIQTIFRQIACFNFELELHHAIREKGALSKEEIAVLLNKHMASYLGPLFKLKEDDGYFFVTWSHIRRFFYVYTYAFGQIVSKALYERYKKDKAYIHEIKKFLSAGSSKSPEEIFKDIGINTADPNFFIEGLQSIEADIRRLKSILKSARDL